MWVRIWQAFFMVVLILDWNIQQILYPNQAMSSGVSINQSGTAINSVSEVWLFIVCEQSSIPDNHSCFNMSKPNTCVLEEGVNQDLLTFWNFKSWRLYAELYSRKETALYFGILYVYSFCFQFIVNSFAKFYGQPLPAVWLSGSVY